MFCESSMCLCFPEERDLELSLGCVSGKVSGKKKKEHSIKSRVRAFQTVPSVAVRVGSRLSRRFHWLQDQLVEAQGQVRTQLDVLKWGNVMKGGFRKPWIRFIGASCLRPQGLPTSVYSSQEQLGKTFGSLVRIRLGL